MSTQDALRGCLPRAAAWLCQRDNVDVPPGSIGGHSLQYELVAGSAERAAGTLGELGPTYATLASLLAEPA